MNLDEQIQKLIDIALKVGEYECACQDADDDGHVHEDAECVPCAIKEILRR